MLIFRPFAVFLIRNAAGPWLCGQTGVFRRSNDRALLVAREPGNVRPIENRPESEQQGKTMPLRIDPTQVHRG